MVTTIIGYTRVVTMVARSNGVDYQRTVVNGNLATTKSVTTRILYRTLISGNTVVPATPIKAQCTIMLLHWIGCYQPFIAY